MDSKELYSLYSQKNLSDTMMFFKGSISEYILSGMTECLIANLYDKTEKGESKKILSVFIELAQNINRYSIDRIQEHNEEPAKDIGVGIIVFNQTRDNYIMIAGNAVSREMSDKLKKHFIFLKSLNEEELKQLRKNKLKNKSKTREKGAGVGLVDIMRKTDNFDFNINNINDNEYFVNFRASFKKRSRDK
ncbi:MAG: hypothetical protein CSB55_04480 [Candidatus Cloacimonadota bacterium]|nr:MAG: hypothetical protein CSB55_04480 [Candidatus Cloacimonadota bacterium]